MSDGLNARIDRPYNQQPATRDAARRRILREPDAEMLLMAFGLADDPVAEAANKAKARAALGGGAGPGGAR